MKTEDYFMAYIVTAMEIGMLKAKIDVKQQIVVIDYMIEKLKEFNIEREVK